MHDKTNDSNHIFKSSDQVRKLFAEPGDLLISYAAFPHIDNLVAGARWGIEPRLNLGILRDYLYFLELLVVHERLAMGQPEYDEETRQTIDQYPDLLAMYGTRGDLDIRETTLKLLVDAGVIYEVIPMHDLTPTQLLDKYLPHSKELQERLQAHEEYFRSPYTLPDGGEVPEAHVKQLARVRMTSSFGEPAYLAEFARSARIPFLLADSEAESIQMSESLEKRTSRSVINILKQQLNAGARELLEHLEERNFSVAFPATPISAQILSESIAPEDLVDTALELRKEYSGFRSACVEIEQELMNEKTTLRSRARLLRDVESMAGELWPQEKHFSRMFAAESTALVGLASAALADPTGKAGTSLVAKVLSFPFESILRVLRKRRVRLFIKAREEFLSSKDYVGKLATMFDLDETSVRKSLAEPSRVFTKKDMKALWKLSQKVLKMIERNCKHRSES